MPSEVLDQTLSDIEDEAERRRVFEKEARRHAGDMVAKARLRAAVLGLLPKDGDAALRQVFISLRRSLDRPWPRGRSYTVHLQAQVLRELMRRRARRGLENAGIPASRG